MVKLFCAVVGVAGSAFSVRVDESDTVDDLKKAIKAEKTNDFKDIDADKLELYVAKRDGEWLTEADVKSGHHGPRAVGSGAAAGRGPVNVLVMLPEQEHAQTELWLVTGSVDNALNTKEIRCRLYRLAGSYLGYYDPNLRAGETDKALWYDEAMLRIHVLFKEERDALLFENELQTEGIKQTSPLDGHTISTTVAPVSRELSELRRIVALHYVPDDTESPQVSMTSFSSSTSIVDVATDEFKYQRIENDEWFGTVGKAQSCHVMSREHCKKHPSYNNYDNDPSNRLALSAEMHEWFDARSFTVPTLKISVESTSEGFVIGNRYKINLVVRAWNAGFAKLIALRLKDGFVLSDDGLEMRTFVYVQNKKVFCDCMEWKRKETEKKWREYDEMAPAVD
ncbi:hypothetical protein PHYSODRAFT_474854 [Phytophthora sojae]|uniref:Crinkler effector protein N-terminal domain-containing protein n=1 Tax=Phytophthora sojae (strain P6497) TaxID=1094619 RepID=G4YMK9_PHYSP|nr:hypothetical protein PHYSODRAFT_474854 [Phytophthora sojae]EGZ28884.1 hypothetical protein PHYSODRAFT_474854 [Phytophthora sojae]|eukprot:XP_009516159.1 hypothetical protein PHYSODRAFT_474854 [Phytophthora sojae]